MLCRKYIRVRTFLKSREEPRKCLVSKSRNQKRPPSKRFGKERSFEQWQFYDEYEAHRLDAVKVVKLCPDNEFFVI